METVETTFSSMLTGVIGEVENCQSLKLEEDTISLFRNPCMGWGLYDDGNDEVQKAEEYWKAQDSAARQYASFFYVRWRWSDMEPEEGKYAWLYDENYKKLIQGALDRGLKLCFRVYDNGQDNLRQATPDYVKKTGAEGYTVKGIRGNDLWTPYPDDPVFQEKLAKFVKAFAEEYDKPEIVDCIDGFALGWWGECHHIKLKGQLDLKNVFDWYTSLYSSAFKNILLVFPFYSEVTFKIEKKIAIEQKGYCIRRDGLGSCYFSLPEQKSAKEMYGKTPLFGESCYWQSYDDSWKPFQTDELYSKTEKFTWRKIYELTYNHAIDYHFNTLDLREQTETKGWTLKAPDLVKGFVTKGGYRLFPTSLKLPNKAKNNSTVKLTHEWRNTGCGYLPNNLTNWGYKYKPAFALFSKDNKLVKLWVDTAAEPSMWLKDDFNSYEFAIKIEDIPTGEYRWAVAIVNQRKDNKPEIALAIKDKKMIDGWVILDSTVRVE